MGRAGGGLRPRGASGRQGLPHFVRRRNLARDGRVALCTLRRGLSGGAGADRVSPRRGGPAVRSGRGPGGLRRTVERGTGDTRSRRPPALARRGPGGAGARIAARRAAPLPVRRLRLAEGTLRHRLRRRACRRHGARQDRADPRAAGASAFGGEGGAAEPSGRADEYGGPVATGGRALRAGSEAVGAARTRPATALCGDCRSPPGGHDLSTAQPGP